MKERGAEREYTPPRLEEAEDKLYWILVPELKRRAIDPVSFKDYRESVVKHDTTLVAALEAEFKKEMALDPEHALAVKRGELCEAIVATQIEESNWMGSNAEVTIPSRYDDIVNGIDIIVGFDEEEMHSHLGLAVDVTESTRGVERKFHKIRESIENGELSQVKYFDSDYFHGALRQVPRVTIGADRTALREVADLLLYFKMRKKRPVDTQTVSKEIAGSLTTRFKEVREKLETHHLQFQILLEIVAQLEVFREYAEKENKEKPAASYEKVLAIAKRILKEKRGMIGEAKYREIEVRIQDDVVHRMIIEKAKQFGR